MANWLGVLLGAELDRGEGGDGIKGAVEGYVIEGAIKTVAPLILTFSIGWGVQFAARKAFEAVTGRDAADEAAG